MLPREQPNLPRACCYYYFMWVQMILQAKKWAGSRKTIKSWWGRWKMPVPKSPSMLPVGEIETEEKEIDRESNRDREVDPQIKIWLHAWCLWGGFVFYDNGLYFNDDNLLGRNRNHLSKMGEGIFGSRLASLVRQALNWRIEGRGCIVSKVAMLLPLLPPGEPLKQQMSLSCLSRWEP